MSEKGQGRVCLVGAGCGAGDLITCRGLALLRRCDAVVYDDLIDGELLSAAPAAAERIYMGKRSGRHAALQEEISALLISLARAGKTVVRLKGGDPFVFGRGGEEAMALQAAGIPWEAVPGVSSAIAIPALAGIPVTHRGLSQSVHIVTARTADTPDGLPACLDRLARLPGTLVFLMGLARLERIAARLTAAGMAPDTPAAVISGGNAPAPAAVRGALADIASRTRAAGVQPPAVIVVGAAAALELGSPARGPLDGRRIGLTGTAAVTEKLGPALAELGAEVFCAQRSLVEPCPLDFDLRTLCGGEPRWLVFTSVNGVDVFFRHLRRQEADLRGLHACRFAAIGGATAAALGGHGIRADLCPEVYTGAGLAQALLRAAEPGEEILLLRSRRGSRHLFRTLADRYPTRDIPLYDLRSDPAAAESARPRLEAMDYLVFSSAGGVELYFEAHGAVPERTVCVCIGEVTAAALQKRDPRPFLTAPEISAQGLVAAILHHRAQTAP